MSQSVIKNYSDFEDAAKTVSYEHLRAVSCRAAMRVLVVVKRFLDERDNAQYHRWALASFRDLIQATCESVSPGQVISENYISFTERHAASDLSFLCENDEAFGFAYLSCFRATVDVTRQELLQRNAVLYHSKAIEIWSHGDRARNLKEIFLPVMIDLSNCRNASHPQEIFSMHELGIGGGIGVEVAYGPSDLLIALKDAGPDWAFWREWYQGFLDGQPLDWELQRRVALIDNDIWEAGPEAVAAEIERIRAAYDVETRAKELEEGIAPYLQPARGIGHNNPPSSIEEVEKTSDGATIIWVAARELKEEAQSDEPDKDRVEKAVGAILGVMKACGLWTAKKVDLGLTIALGAGAAAIGKKGGEWITQNTDKITDLIEAVQKLLPFLN